MSFLLQPTTSPTLREKVMKQDVRLHSQECTTLLCSVICPSDICYRRLDGWPNGWLTLKTSVLFGFNCLPLKSSISFFISIIFASILKCDAVSVLEKEHDYRDEHFDFIQSHIRRFCLHCILVFNACLFFLLNFFFLLLSSAIPWISVCGLISINIWH